MRFIARLAAASLPMSVKVVLAVGAVVSVASGLAGAAHGARPFEGSWRALTLDARTGIAPEEAGMAGPTTATAAHAAPPAPAATDPPPPPPPRPAPSPVVAAAAPAPRPASATAAAQGCQAALAYLASHAAPGFAVACPHDAGGHEATTVCNGPPDCAAGTMFIWIADPCPAAYMNEASNSWVLLGRSDAPWDPYGYCGEPGNPFG